MTEPTFLSATRTAYDTFAADYAAKFRPELADKPLDRALFAALAEMAPPGLIADIGCGPGHVAAHLNSLGLNTFGIDLSPQMIAVAREAYPHLRFEVGSMTALDLPEGSLAGIVGMYSIIHIPAEQLPTVFAEFHRVLALGGQLMLAFQVGDGQRQQRTEAFGHPIALDYYMRPADDVAELLSQAGLEVHARLLREPYEVEAVQRAYLLARKPV